MFFIYRAYMCDDERRYPIGYFFCAIGNVYSIFNVYLVKFFLFPIVSNFSLE